jgi:NADPH:quinone reductase
MRAITIDREGASAGLDSNAPAPTPASGEVLVRVHASAVNPIDAAIAAGMLTGMFDHEYPITLGRDFAGTVEALGDGADSFAVGDEVFGVVPPIAPSVHAGAWAELIVVGEATLVERPPAVDVNVAGAAAFAPAAAIPAVDAVAPQAGETVLVVGATGGVGTVVVQLLRAAGAKVIASVLREDEAYLRALGVVEFVPREGDVAAAVRERAPGGVDALVDLVSAVPGAFEAALKPGARVASTRHAAGEGPGRSNVNATPTAEVLGRIADLLARNILVLPISATYELADAPTALADLAGSHTQGKLAVRLH